MAGANHLPTLTTPVRRIIHALAVVGCVVLAACGGPAAPGFDVHGARVVVSSAEPFTTRADFPTRVESTIDAALRYWGGTWSQLEGKTLSFEGDEHVSCEGTDRAIGCYEGRAIRVSTRDVDEPFRCVEETVLVHEIGHAVIGDPDHVDPRWMDFDSVEKDLAGRPGYDATGTVDCRIFVNVWRHPPVVRATGG